MVDYEKIIKELNKNKEKPISLFFVAQMDELVDTWTIIFAADWVTDKNIHSTYAKISKLIDKNGSKSDIDKVSRIWIFNSNHYLVKELLKLSDKSELNEIKINGNTIHRGTIIYPKK